MTVPVASTGEHAAAVDELRSAFGALQASIRRLKGRETRVEGLGIAHWGVVAAIAREGEPTAGQVAAAAALTPATVTEMIDRLVAEGLVERRRADDDRRIVRNRLTPKGRRVHRRLEASWQRRWHDGLADLAPDELRAGTLVVERLSALFDGIDAG